MLLLSIGICFSRKLKITIVVFSFFSCNVASASELRFITLDVVPWASYDAVEGQYVGIFPEIVKEI